MKIIKKLTGIALASVLAVCLQVTVVQAEEGELFSSAYAMSELARKDAENVVRDAIAEESGNESAFALPQEIVEGESTELSIKIKDAVLAGQQAKVVRCDRCAKYRAVYRTRYRTVTRRRTYLVSKRRTRTIMVARRRVRVSYVPEVRYRTVYRPVRVRYVVRRPVRRTVTRYVPRTRVYYSNVRRTQYIRRRVAYRTRTLYKRHVTYRRVGRSTRRVRSHRRRRTLHRVRRCHRCHR